MGRSCGDYADSARRSGGFFVVTKVEEIHNMSRASMLLVLFRSRVAEVQTMVIGSVQV
jgi:hypothetical protein